MISIHCVSMALNFLSPTSMSNRDLQCVVASDDEMYWFRVISSFAEAARRKGEHGKGKGKGKQGQHAQDKDKSKDKSKDSVECWNCGKRGHCSKDCWSKKNTKDGSKGKHQPKNADGHNLDSKPSIAEPEVEIDELSMTYLNVDALQESEKMRGSEWIKIGVDTGAGKTAWPQSITYGTMILVTVISLSAQQLENLSKVANECKLRVATIGD